LVVSTIIQQVVCILIMYGREGESRATGPISASSGQWEASSVEATKSVSLPESCHLLIMWLKVIFFHLSQNCFLTCNEGGGVIVHIS
jgi:hypothetical protein